MLVAGDVIYSKMRLNAPPHYFILLTDPDADGHALTVNITTECGDVTTVCGPHQYGALSHSSEVFYAAATFADAVTFETAALAGGAGKLTMRKESRCSAAFLRTLRAGILKSPKTRKQIKAFCKKTWDTNGDLFP